MIEIPDSPIAAVRKRPAMYFGDRGAHGIEHLVLEIIGNALDEHLAGRAHRLDVTADNSGWITIEDDGGGLDLVGAPGASRPRFFDIFESRHSTPTLDAHVPHVHVTRRIDALGVMICNAGSERFEVTTVRNGRQWNLAYEKGRLVSELRESPVTRPSGTRIRLRPDGEIFAEGRLDLPSLESHLRDLAWLSPALAWSLNGRSLQQPRGLQSKVEMLLDSELCEGSSLWFQERVGDIEVDIALAARGRGPAILQSYVNHFRTESGVHRTGVTQALTSVPNWDSFGIACVVHLGLQSPRFEGPTRAVLANAEVTPIIFEVLIRELRRSPWWRERLAPEAV